MFYRTNLTLSAFTNRLNLGTRSFAVNANVNHGGKPSRALHTHHDSMRGRMNWYQEIPIILSEIDVPSSRSSSSQVQPVPPGRLSVRPGRLAVRVGEVPVSGLISLEPERSILLTQQLSQRLLGDCSVKQERNRSVSWRKSTGAKQLKPARAIAYATAWRATQAPAATAAAVAAK
jgi:hypothetical protein